VPPLRTLLYGKSSPPAYPGARVGQRNWTATGDILAPPSWRRTVHLAGEPPLGLGAKQDWSVAGIPVLAWSLTPVSALNSLHHGVNQGWSVADIPAVPACCLIPEPQGWSVADIPAVPACCLIPEPALSSPEIETQQCHPEADSLGVPFWNLNLAVAADTSAVVAPFWNLILVLYA